MIRKQRTFLTVKARAAFALLFLLSSLPALNAQSRNDLPQNLGHGMKELLQMRLDSLARGRGELDLRNSDQLVQGDPASASGIFNLHVDSLNRVLVNIHLSDSSLVSSVSQQLAGLGASIIATNSNYQGGVISAFLPMDAATQVATSPGVSSVLLAHRAISHAGRVTSQGASVLRTDIANAAGFDGRGITVGVMSDSFNTAQFFGVTDTALSDVLSGDLPNTTAIPGGEGLKFLIELDPTVFGPQTDEGRGMAQIVHDLAPGASLCFATAFVSEVDFANNIRTLRTDPRCNADVIVDDISYLDEPFFSDGILAQAVDDVAFSDTLAGRKVAYFSSAGNEAGQGYSSDLRIIHDGAARSLPLSATRIDLSSIPSTIDTSGGFHNFDPNGGVLLAQDFVFARGTAFSFQWDDPFDLTPSGITTDLNLLFFSPTTGKFLFAVADNNFQTNEPIELFALNTSSRRVPSAEVLMAVVRTGQGSHLARRIKYVAFGAIADLSGVIHDDTPVTFGHNSARGANGVAALSYAADPAVFGAPGFDPHLEDFSSPGPVVIAFDRNGRRLEHAEVRQKPDIAAVDGTNTTFFPEALLFGPGQDYEAQFGIPDGFPNFFGTSAAAPHAAAVGALLIQRNGGPGSISPENVSRVLKASAPPRDFDFAQSAAAAQSRDANVVVLASGDDFSSASPTFFEVGFSGSHPGQTLNSLTIDLTGTGLVFNPATFPLTLGFTTGPTIVSATPAGVSAKLTLTFSGFTPGNVVAFGINRDVINKAGQPIGGGNSADLVAGAAMQAALSPRDDKHSGDVLNAQFQNQIRDGYRGFDGFGLIDAVNALKLHDHDGDGDKGKD